MTKCDLKASFSMVESFEALGKTFSVNDDGTLNKVAGGNISAGAIDFRQEPFSKLPAILDGCNSNQALMLGVVKPEFWRDPRDTNKKLVTAKAKQNYHANEPSVIARTQEFVGFPEGCGLMLLDFDPSTNHQYDVPEFLSLMAELDPNIATAAKVIKYSLSAGVHFVDQAPKTSGIGVHIYFAVADATDLPRYRDRLVELAWLRGYGKFRLSNEGYRLADLPFDACVFSPERLIFESKPQILDERLRFSPIPTEFIDGEVLDTRQLKNADADNTRAVETAKRAAKAALADEVKTFDTRQLKIKIDAGMLPDIAKAQIEIARERKNAGILSLEHKLYLDDGEIVSVRDVLVDADKFLGETLACPCCGEHGGAGKAIIYLWPNGKAYVRTFKHGGTNFHFESLPDAKATVDDWRQALDDNTSDFNKSHAVVYVGSRCRVLVESSTGDLNFYSKHDFLSFHSNKLLKCGEDKFKNRAALWLSDPARRTYSSVKFAPNAVLNDDEYNLYQGLAVEPAENEPLIAPVLRHIKEILCDDKPELFDYTMNWLAQSVQFPEKQAGSALVIRSCEGTGKSIFADFMLSIFGAHGQTVTNPRHLIGNFNAHLQKTLLLVCNEAFFAGDPSSAGVLKALITDTDYMVENKGLDAYSQKNYLKIMMLTNNDFCVPAGRDARRYCVLTASNAKKGDTGYFTELVNLFARHDAKVAFLAHLLAVDLHGWHSGLIPESAGLRDQRLHKLPAHARWLANCFETENLEPCDKDFQQWSTFKSTAELYHAYEAWFVKERLRSYEKINMTMFGRYFAKMFRRFSDGKRRGFLLGLCSDAKRAFEIFEKVELELEFDFDEYP